MVYHRPSALRGLRVADFSWVGAGPFMTKPLADHGADVIKVESLVRTDVIRNMHPFRDGRPGPNRSGYFANRNSSKRSIALDLASAPGRELAQRLVSVSDVVVNNFSPGTMDRLGLGYDEVSRLRPDVIYLDMPMQGNTGPHAAHRGYGLSIGALSGFYELCGYPDAPPVGSGTNFPDHVPNPLHGTIAILAALLSRAATGQGARIEVAQIESTVNAIGGAVVAVAAGCTITRKGNRDDHDCPSGVYPCAGGDWCAISVGSDAQWHDLVAALGSPAELRLDRFAECAARRAAENELDELIAGVTAGRPAGEIVELLTTRGVAAARVNNAWDVLYRDAQLAYRGHWVTLDHPEMGPSVYDAPPYRLSRTPGYLRSPAPLLGEHTREVCLGLLQLSEAEFDAAVESGAVA